MWRIDETSTHAGVAIEDVNIITGVQVVDSTLPVDFESICERDVKEERGEGQIGRKIRETVRTMQDSRSSILMLTLPHQMSSLLVSS